MKINVLPLHNLRNEEHFKFMSEANVLVKNAGDRVKAVLSIIGQQLDGLVKREDAAMEKIRKSGYTDPIADADAARDTVYRGLTNLVLAYSDSAVMAECEAAAKLQLIIDHYGNVAKRSYNEETAGLYSCLQDLKGCPAELALLHAARWVDDVSAANDAFDALMNKRYSEDLAHQTEDIKQLRKSLDAAYGQMVSTINASIILNGETGYIDFVNELNIRIEYFKNTLHQRKGRKAVKDEKVKKE